MRAMNSSWLALVLKSPLTSDSSRVARNCSALR